MKKFILLPLAFTIAITFFSFSCTTSVVPIDDQGNPIDPPTSTNFAVSFGSVTKTGTTGTTGMIRATTPSTTVFGDKIPSEYSYTLYYVKASDAYPITSQAIADFLPLTAEELKTAATTASVTLAQASSDPATPEADTPISFAFSNLANNTLYLFFIETSHRTEEASSYTSISQTSGWFSTPGTTADPITNPTDPRIDLFFNLDGTGITRNLQIVTPTIADLGTTDILDYTYTLYYLNTAIAYPSETQAIESFTPITGEELKIVGRNTPEALKTISPNNAPTLVSGNSGDYYSFGFDFVDLVSDRIYLFTVESSPKTAGAGPDLYTLIAPPSAPGSGSGWIDTTVTTTSFTLQSSSVTDNENLEAKFYGKESALTQQRGAENISPALSWNQPTGANGYLIVMYDTFSFANNWIHWIRTEDAGTTLAVDEGVGSTVDTSNQYPTESSSQAKYAGPQPPLGNPHTYVIKIFALENALSTTSGIPLDPLKDLLNRTTGEKLFGATIIGVSSISVNAAYLAP